ncbi:glycosyltransferase [Pseudenterobacter timonensis]|uniref:glycosyltransferase n=1 Tax=Pseudenterobacter timonensis TaxID=1755099 RepID=UPI00077B8221|nr:glycosyltransferase [Pseudenterobacter timonensis]
MKKIILPIVVLYKKRLIHAESINTLLDSDVAGSICDIYVYDNTPGENNNFSSNQKVYRGRNIIYFHNPNNAGVSTAYNTGLKIAKQLGYKFVLILDQDTHFPFGAVESYLSAINNYPEIKIYVPSLVTKNGEHCSPLKYAFHRGFVIGKLESNIYSLDKYSPINSGMLLDVETALRSGGYKEDVYLDFSDFQFIERLKKYTSHFYLIPLSLQQDLSNEDENYENLVVRYEIYCQCAKRCHRESILDDAIYFAMVLIRGLKLLMRTKKIIFLKVFLKSYIRGKK